MEERKRHYDKARVYASGELVEVKCTLGYMDHNYETEDGRCFSSHELDFKCEPDYWTRLEHQYAGMVMQGVISSKRCLDIKTDMYDIPHYSQILAHALVGKMKEERK